MIALVSDTSFSQLVSDALRNYQSTLALSRSDLASSPLVTPTLVKDESSPTAEERGYGLRLVVQWAVNLLAPAAPTYPMGEYRPLDDPTWHDPRWWGYNILRHRYLEPLHPDDFVEGGRYTESLLALTGISSSDAFFDERQRAIRLVAERLRQQLIDGQASSDLQRLALQEAVYPLAQQPEAMRLLGIASTFDDVFPRPLLLKITEHERLQWPVALLSTLISQRFLLTGDEGENLWLSPVLRRYVYDSQTQEECRQRHRRIAAFYEGEDDALRAARHWQRASEDNRAMRVLLPAVPELIHELQIKELTELLQQLEARRMEDEQWYSAQVLLSDLFQRAGQFEDTLAACRRALQATNDDDKQARVYRRMGKLYEGRNQGHALRYYQQAVERFATADPELAELLKDRGWLYFYRQEWELAEADLHQALACAPPAASRLQADILDAMANLARVRGERDQALAYAERALAIREQVGDLLAIAKSLGNLGFLYRAMKEYRHAVLAHQEALTTYQKLGNKELMAAAWLNIGAAHYHNDDLNAAIDAYRQSLEIGQSLRLPLIELKAHYNLAEALAATAKHAEAIRHWNEGYRICQQHNFADQASDFVALAHEHTLAVDLVGVQDALTVIDLPGLFGEADNGANDSLYSGLNADEALVIELARREQAITARRLMVVADISRATATRRLSALAEKGLLSAHGHGRGAYYALATPSSAGKGDGKGESKGDGKGAREGEPSTRPPAEMGESMRTLLGMEQAALSRDYGVTGLGIVPVQGQEAPKIIVRFRELPDLTTFFQLRQKLASRLRCEIELLPDFALPPLRPPSDVAWVW